MIYIIYFLLLLFLLRVERLQSSQVNVFRFIIPIIYILFIGLRGANVGVDTPVYYDHYYTFGEWGCDFVEKGFDWLNQFFYHRGCTQAPFFVACAAFAVIPVVLAVNKELSRQGYTMFMLIFCTTTFVSMCNGMRQNMACGLLFLLVFWYENSSMRLIYRVCLYLLGILFASLFHVSVLLVAPVVLLRHVRASNNVYFFIYLISFVFVFVNISPFLPDIQIGTRDYGRYLGGEMVNRAASSLGFIITVARNFLFLWLLARNKLFSRFPLLSNLAFLMIIFTNLGYNIPILGRVNMYFSFFYLYMLSIIFLQRNSTNSKVISLALIIIVVVLTVYGIIAPANKLLPYTFYWDNSIYSKYLPY